MAIHTGAAASQEDQPRGAGLDPAFDGPTDGWRARDEEDLVAFAVDAERSVAMFLAEVLDVAAGRVEDPQPEESEQGDERAVTVAPRLRGGARHGLALVNESITPDRAHQLVVEGAAVAWDDCGSRGWNGGVVVWFDEADTRRLATAGPPTLRRKRNHRDANLVEYRRMDGQPVVIAEMRVRWGDLMY